MASVLGLHESDQVDDPVGVTHLVVIPASQNKLRKFDNFQPTQYSPRDQLDESFGELDASLGVKNG